VRELSENLVARVYRESLFLDLFSIFILSKHLIEHGENTTLP
jgi:hypothetical protein